MTEPVQLELPFPPPAPSKGDIFKFLYGAKFDHDMNAQLLEWQRRMMESLDRLACPLPLIAHADRLTATEVAELQLSGRTARMVDYREIEGRAMLHWDHVPLREWTGGTIPPTGRRADLILADDVEVVRTAGIEPA